MREENDVAQWLEDCCVLLLDSSGSVKSSDAYASYRAWKSQRGAVVESHKVWIQRLSASAPSLEHHKSSVMHLRGLRLVPPNPPIPWR